MVCTVEIVSNLKGSITRDSRPSTDEWPYLEYVGAGRSAVVFRIKGEDKVLKLFYPECEHIAQEEAAIYRILKGSSFYPALHEAGENYLVIDYIEGMTLFDCLTNGTQITESHIDMVDQALAEARQRGLTPSDIHLRNIVLTTTNQIKLIDVARFRETRSCQQWNDIRRVFYLLYNRTWFPIKISPTWLNLIAFLYKKIAEPVFHLSKQKQPAD